MRIAYLTTDEVNEHLALELSQQYNATLCPLQPRDPPPDGRFDAVLYDLDYLPPHEREKVLSALFAGPFGWPVAVHSYHLGEDQIEALRANGVAVHRRLGPEVFRTLCRAARSVGEGFRAGSELNKNHEPEKRPG